MRYLFIALLLVGCAKKVPPSQVGTQTERYSWQCVKQGKIKMNPAYVGGQYTGYYLSPGACAVHKCFKQVGQYKSKRVKSWETFTKELVDDEMCIR